MDPRSPTLGATSARSVRGTTAGGTVGADDPAPSLSQALVVCNDAIPLQQLPPPDVVHDHDEWFLRYPDIQPAIDPTTFSRSQNNNEHR
jgi:hypothetical protein